MAATGALTGEERARLPRRTRMRRTWPARLLVAGCCFLALGCVGAATGFYYALDKYEQLPRLPLAAVLTPVGDKRPIGETLPVDDDEPPVNEDDVDAQNILLVGSDTREGIDPDDPDAGAFLNGDYGGQRTDTIMILRLDPSIDQVLLLSLNRDLWVDIAGTRRKDRINTAYTRGPDVLIQTISQNFGIPIHHYVEVNFVGFKKLVDAVGGVPVYFPHPARDTNTGLDIATAGCHNLGPEQALAYTRSRHYRYLDDNGRWRTDPTGDLGRAERQQGFIRAALKRAIIQGFRDPFKLNEIVNALLDEEFIAVDDAFTAGDIIDLGLRFRSLDPNEIVSYLLPSVSMVTSGGAQVLLLQEKAAQPYLDLFRGTTTAPTTDAGSGASTTIADPLEPDDVTVRLLAGPTSTDPTSTDPTSTEPTSTDPAVTLGDELSAIGFAVLDGAATTGGEPSRTVIRHAPGHEAQAALLAAHLAEPPVLEEVASVTGADLVLVVGTDFAGVLDEPREEPTQPTTTVTTVPLPPTTVIGVAPPAEVSCG